MRLLEESSDLFMFWHPLATWKPACNWSPFCAHSSWFPEVTANPAFCLTSVLTLKIHQRSFPSLGFHRFFFPFKSHESPLNPVFDGYTTNSLGHFWGWKGWWSHPKAAVHFHQRAAHLGRLSRGPREQWGRPGGQRAMPPMCRGNVAMWDPEWRP